MLYAGAFWLGVIAGVGLVLLCKWMKTRSWDDE